MQRVTAIKYGVFSTGESKKGWILISPTGANDKPFFYYSTQASLGIYASCLDSTAGTIGQLPYTASQIWNSPTESQVPLIRSRVVCVGVRVRCISPKMWISGRLYAYMHPQHGNVNNYSIFDLGDKRETFRSPISDSWTEFSLIPVDNREFEFPDVTIPAPSQTNQYTRAANTYLFPWSNGQTFRDPPTADNYLNEGIPCFVLMVSAPETDEVPTLEFEFEIVAHMEYIGTPCDQSATLAHSDPNGLGEVNAGANNSFLLRAEKPVRDAAPSILDGFVSNIEENSQRMTSVMGSVSRVLGASAMFYGATRMIRSH
jgi:hypothetical protein